METIKLENVSFNKLKEFTSLGNKKNITIKGKFTLIGEYQLITKDGGDSMTLSQLTKFTVNFVQKQEAFNREISASIKHLTKIVKEGFNKIEAEVKSLRCDLNKVIKINNLKSY